MDMPSMLSPTSPETPIKFTEHSRYFAICTPLGKTCLKEFHMSLDWDDDEEEEDQVKGEDRDKDNVQKTAQAYFRLFAVMALAPKPPKPSITENFCKMSSVTPIMDALDTDVTQLQPNRKTRSRNKTK